MFCYNVSKILALSFVKKKDKNKEWNLKHINTFYILISDMELQSGSPCHPNPCLNGGSCHFVKSDYHCLCAPGRLRGVKGITQRRPLVDLFHLMHEDLTVL